MKLTAVIEPFTVTAQGGINLLNELNQPVIHFQFIGFSTPVNAEINRQLSEQIAALINNANVTLLIPPS